MEKKYFQADNIASMPHGRNQKG